jgi:hypothetical protein
MWVHCTYGIERVFIVCAKGCGCNLCSCCECIVCAGIVNSLLSFRALLPLSRLTYCAYLTHPLIMVVTGFSMDGPLHLHNLLVVSSFSLLTIWTIMDFNVVTTSHWHSVSINVLSLALNSMTNKLIFVDF